MTALVRSQAAKRVCCKISENGTGKDETRISNNMGRLTMQEIGRKMTLADFPSDARDPQ